MGDETFIVEGLKKQKKEIEENLRLKNFAIDTSINAVAFANLEGDITYVNKSFLKMWGSENEEEVLGKNVALFWPSEIKVARVIEILFIKGSWFGELIAKRKDKTPFNIHLSACVVKDEQGKPQCLMASFIDITKRKKSEEELLKSEKKFRAYVEFSPTPVFVVDGKGSYTFVNESACSLVGYSEEELLKMSIPDITSPKNLKNNIDDFSKLLSEGKIVSEINLVKKNGNELDAILSASRISEDQYIGFVTDITERKQFVEDLLRKEEQYRTILQTTFDGFWISDLQGRIIDVNDTYCDLIGYSRAELLGMNIKDIEAIDDHADVEKRIKYIIEKGHSRFESIHKRKDGRIINIETSVNYVSMEEKFLVFIRDITERKQTEEALRISEAKYRELINNIGEGVGIVDINEQFIFTNPAAEKIFGVPEDSLVGRNLKDFTSSNNFNRIKGETEKRSTGKSNTYDFEIIRTNGDIRQIDVTSTPHYDEKNKFIGSFGIFRDNTDRRNTEKRLQQLLNQQKIIFDNANIGIAFLKERRFKWVNKYFESLFGYSEGEILGIESRILYRTNENYIKFGEVAYSFLAEGKKYQTEYQMKRKDSNFIWCLLTGKAIDPDNLSEGSIWIIDDIDERKKAEEQIRILTAAVEQSIDVILLTDTEGNIEYVNPFFEKLTGYSFSEAKGKNPRLLQSGKTPLKIYKELWNKIMSGESWKGEFYNKKKNGEFYWENAVITPIKDKSGNIIKFMAIKEDITFKKETENALRDSESKLKALVENAYTGIARLNNTGKFLDFNKRFYEMLGFSPDELKNLNNKDITHPEDTELTKNNMSDLFQHKIEYFQMESRILRKDKSMFWAHITVSPIFDKNGEINEVVGIIIDIDEKKKMENFLKESEIKLRELNATKDKFFSIIAHDLKNPIGSLFSYSEFLVQTFDKKTPEKIKEGLDMFYQASRQAFNLLENLLEWSRSETGSMKYSPKKINLKNLIWEKFELFMNIATQKNINLVYEDPENLYIFADKNMVDTVLRNLFSNAIKFTGSGGEVRINAKERVGYIEISIKDTGIGIKEEDKASLFRVDKKTTKLGTAGEKGTGLGLLLCKEFCEKNKGKIWMESEQDLGTTFHFTLPISD